MSATTTQTPDFTSAIPTQSSDSQQQNSPGGPIYLYAFTLIAFLICVFACCSAWRGVVIRRRRRELGLPELEEWGMGPGVRRADEEEAREPPAMHEVWLEGGMQKDGRWYWGEKRGDVDGGWDGKMPISFSLAPLDAPRKLPTSPHESDPELGITVFSALSELSPHRWPLFRRRPKQPKPSSPAPAPPVDPMPEEKKLVTSMLIAMPTPHHLQSERKEGLMVFEDEFPEVLFGVYEGRWTGDGIRLGAEGREAGSNLQ